jgi:hypothetical protein
LLLVLVIGTVLTRRNTPAQALAPDLTTQAGPYTLAVFINPNPPLTSQITHLTLHVTDTTTGQSVNDAGVELRGFMASMDMTMGPFYATPQQDGTYLVDVHLFMGGQWQFMVTITDSGAPPASTLLKLNSNPST